jgi:hypothetical protein
MAHATYGDVLLPSGVEIGTFDLANRSFSTGGALPGAVRVRLHQSAANSNAVATNFLRIAGFQAWEVNVEAVAQRYYPECLNDGLVARGIVDISSNNGFVNRICVHGQQGIVMQNHNFYESGVTVIMPNPNAQLTIPTGATLINVVLGSRAVGNGQKPLDNANINFSSNVSLGRPGNCNPGGGVQIFSSASVHFSSSMTINGLQVVAAGDVDLGARDYGINGISVQAGQDVTLTSNNVFGLCSGGAPTLLTVAYYRLVH